MFGCHQWWAIRACEAFSAGMNTSEAVTYVYSLNFSIYSICIFPSSEWLVREKLFNNTRSTVQLTEGGGEIDLGSIKNTYTWQTFLEKLDIVRRSHPAPKLL